MTIAPGTIADLIPQQAPFIMVDDLVEVTPDYFESRLHITSDNLFVTNGRLGEAALMENIAQTCAAAFGYMQREGNAPPKIGVIGGVSKLELFELPVVGATVTTKVQVTFRMDQIYVVKGENYCGGIKLMECELKIIIP